MSAVLLWKWKEFNMALLDCVSGEDGSVLPTIACLGQVTSPLWADEKD